MSLERRAIVSAFNSAIKNAQTIAGKNVFSYRENKNWLKDLPAVNVYAVSETGGEILGSAPIEYKRSIDLLIECTVSGKDETVAMDSLDRLLDQIGQAIGAKISFDKSFRTLFNKAVPTNIEIDITENGSQVVASGTMTYSIEYIFEAVRTQPRLNDLLKLGATYSAYDSTTTSDDLADVPT
jgi:hypothetical protein